MPCRSIDEVTLNCQHDRMILIYMTEFTVKCPVIFCTQTARDTKSHGNKCIKETNSEWPA